MILQHKGCAPVATDSGTTYCSCGTFLAVTHNGRIVFNSFLYNTGKLKMIEGNHHTLKILNDNSTDKQYSLF
jgi:hypothetical protein